MSRRWRYLDSQPGHLPELDILVEEGAEFDAPDDWQPEPYPHPVYVEVGPKADPEPQENA